MLHGDFAQLFLSKEYKSCFVWNKRGAGPKIEHIRQLLFWAFPGLNYEIVT
jgi:hypothetical protein